MKNEKEHEYYEIVTISNLDGDWFLGLMNTITREIWFGYDTEENMLNRGYTIRPIRREGEQNEENKIL